MPKPRYPGLHKEITRHGRVVWYFRRGAGKRIRIDGSYGTPEFNAAYEAALSGTAVDRNLSPPRSSPTKPTGRQSYVYFIQCADRVKIGVSHSPTRRAQNLQIGASERLTVVKKIRGDSNLERQLHQRFAALRIRGEWFSLRGEIAEFIRTNADAGPDEIAADEAIIL